MSPRPLAPARLAPLLLVLGACSAIVTPDPSRLGGRDAGPSMDAPFDPRIDAWVDRDASVEPPVDTGVPIGEDAPSLEPDAFVPPTCTEPCTEGRICVGTMCLCPEGACCPGCNTDEVCLEGRCEACGAADQWCCRGGGCESGTTCEASRCTPCGRPGEICCAGACLDGVTCTPDGRCMAECGLVGQDCCDGGVCFEGACRGGSLPFGSATCVACGERGQPCCDGGCGAGLTCSSGMCAGCGQEGEPCCGGRCEGDLLCNGGARCEACGARFQACCAGGVCREGSCMAGSRCF